MQRTKIAGKKKVRLEDIKPIDRVNGYPPHVPKWFTKLFETLPGGITWFFILLPFLAALSGNPEFMVFYVAFLTIYWAIRGLLFMSGIFIAYKRMEKEVEIDWVKKLKYEKLPYENMKYVYICPIVNEGMDILEPSMEAWIKSDIGAKKISVVFALEERFAKESLKNTAILKKKYGKYFREMMDFVHPNDIEGEVEGVKGANINWATRLFVEKVEERGENLEDYLLITCDSDMRPHPKYLSAITYKYFTVPNPRRTFFSTAVHTFLNNLFRVPVIIRVASSSLTLALMSEWVMKKHMRETFSSYVVNLKTVEEVGFWDPEVGIDDTTFYFNALIRYAGDFRGEEVYIPTYNDAVENETRVKSYRSYYKQQLRWGWGVITFPMTFAALYKNKEIPLANKIKIAATHINERLILKTVVYTITLGIPILNIMSPEFQYSSASYNLPRLMSLILSIVVLFNVPVLYVRRKVTGIPKNWSFLRNLQDILEIFLVSVNLLTFGFFPSLQAQTEMMVGKGFRKRYYATEKVAIKK